MELGSIIQLGGKVALANNILKHLDEINWEFQRGPHVPTKPYPTKVDPFPCYPHDEVSVILLIEKVVNLFPIGFDINWYILHYECESRVNGWAQRSWLYNSEKPDERAWEGIIILNGKRIPIHPAVTRYLVAHEYGHLVEYWIEYKLNKDDQDGEEKRFRERYAELRNLPEGYFKYGGGNWHTYVGDIIANDFRVCVTGIEEDFYPHPHIDHPNKVEAVKEFWKDMLKYKYENVQKLQEV